MIMFCNLLPQRDKAGPMPCWIKRHLFIMMHINHNRQIVCKGLFHRPIHPLEKFWVNCVRSYFQGVSTPTHGKAHRCKASLMDQLKKFLPECHAPLALAGCLQSVAQIYSPCELLVHGKSIHLWLRCWAGL